jgi:hypothetical protein
MGLQKHFCKKKKVKGTATRKKKEEDIAEKDSFIHFRHSLNERLSRRLTNSTYPN